MKKVRFSIYLATLLALLTGCGTDSNLSQLHAKQVEIIHDVTQYANISSAELVALMGTPDDIVTGTCTGAFEIPCEYYEYDNHSELGEISFALVNDQVVRMSSYNIFPYDKDNIMNVFGINPADDCVLARDTGVALRYRCPTDKVDDFWINLIEEDAFGSLVVTYDMMYYDEWYLPFSAEEEISYKTDTEIAVKSILKSPKSADFPWYDWEYGKNNFYFLVSSYVDAINSFGAEIRSYFTFVYSNITREPVWVIWDDEVIVDNGYVPTSDLVLQLVREMNLESESLTQEFETFDNVSINSDELLIENSNTSDLPSSDNVNQSYDTVEESYNNLLENNTSDPGNSHAIEPDIIKETNDIDLLEDIIMGVCSAYNSNDNTALGGCLFGYINSATDVTIEHYIGETIYADTEYAVYEMENKIQQIIIDELSGLFPESITVSVYSTYEYADYPHDEYSENTWDEYEEYEYSENIWSEASSDLSGIFTELTDEQLAELEKNAGDYYGD